MEGEDRDAVGGSARPVESRQVIDLQRVAVEVDVFGAELLGVHHDECEVVGHCVVRLLAGVDEPAVRGRRGDPVASVEVGPGDRREVRSRTVEEEAKRVSDAHDEAPITRKFGRSGRRSGSSAVIAKGSTLRWIGCARPIHGSGRMHRTQSAKPGMKPRPRSEEHTYEPQSLMRIPDAVVFWNKKK